MKIGEIFSLDGCGGRGYGSGSYDRSGGYGGFERHYRHGDYFRGSSYGGYDGEHYGRHDGGLLGILGRY